MRNVIIIGPAAPAHRVSTPRRQSDTLVVGAHHAAGQLSLLPWWRLSRFRKASRADLVENSGNRPELRREYVGGEWSTAILEPALRLSIEASGSNAHVIVASGASARWWASNPSSSHCHGAVPATCDGFFYRGKRSWWWRRIPPWRSQLLTRSAGGHAGPSPATSSRLEDMLDRAA